MDTAEKLKAWLIKMGWEGKIPENFKPFCNPSTALIWEQLVYSVNPRQEVEHIRNNILINKLLQNNENCESPTIKLLKQESKFALKEIAAWNKKCKLQQQILAMQERIHETTSKVNNSANNNKMKYMNLENVRQKIKENQHCTFLLNTKSNQLEAETKRVAEILTLANNLTPVESEEQNKTEVLETLKKCSEKLEKIIEKQHEVDPVPCILTTNSFEVRTPRNRLRKRGFLSVKKPHNLFSSTKISHNHRKPKADDSLGLLDDLSVTFDNALAASSFKELNFSNVGMCYDLPILNDQNLNDLIEELLHRNDRLVVWNVLAERNESRKVQLVNAIVESDRKNSNLANSGQKDGVLTKLYAIHVEYEAKAVKTKLQVQELQQNLCNLQKAILAKLPQNFVDLQTHLLLQQKETGLTAAVKYVHKSINLIREATGNSEDLQITKERSRHMEEKIVARISSIEHKLNVFKQIHETMAQARNETCMLARKLGQFTVDSDWTLMLNSHLSSMEIEMFLDFPLEYNRLVRSSSTFVHNLPINFIPYQEDFDSNTVLILVTLLQSPWSPAETLLFDIVRAKRKIEHLKALKCVPDAVNEQGCTLEQLQSQESYTNYALEKLKSLIHAESASKTTQMLSQVRETIRLWLEMPVRNFVSSKRLFNGAPYPHYEKKFDDFYKQL